MINTICKLFYRMDMLYLIINKEPTFYLKRWALGGGASKYIYILYYIYEYPKQPPFGCIKPNSQKVIGS